MPSSPSRPALGSALVLALLAISSAALWIRVARSPPLAIAFYRLAYATALLAPFALRRALRELPSLTLRERALLVASGVALGLHLATWIASLAPSSPYATSVAASATLVTLHPVLVALATPWLLHRKVEKGVWLGIGLALAGGAVITLGDAPRGTHRLGGDLLALAGAATAAGYLLAGARLRGRLGLLAYVVPVYAVATLTLGALSLASGTSLAVTSPREHALFVALAVGPMILGHTVFNWALAHVPAWVVSATILAEPVASTLLVFLALGEAPTLDAAAGGAIVLAGLAVLARRALPEREA